MGYCGGWKAQNSEGTLRGWLIICGTSGGTTPGNIIIDQLEVEIAVGGMRAALQINSNMH